MCITFFLLRDLFFTYFASFFYLVIHSILFYYIHSFIWILWTPLIIFMSLGWSFLASCTPCQSRQKGVKIVENMWFLSKILHVRGSVDMRDIVRITCIFSFLSFIDTLFLYTGLLTMFTYIVLLFDDVCLLHLSLHVLFLFYL